MKRIGFVDYKLENFHANVFLKNFRGPLVARGYTVAGAYSLDAQDGQAWCAKNNVAWFPSADALNEHVDCYAVLAPGNPETHLELCKKVFPSGKATYVDKTFAPSLEIAKEIFALADECKVKVQTTSALRYTDVQKKVAEIGGENLKHMIAWGCGSSFDEYAIHPVEMVVSCMGPGATRVMRRGVAAYSQLLIDFTGERTAVVNVYVPGETPFAAALTTEKTTQYLQVNLDTLFSNMAAAILDFFDAPKSLIDRNESLMVRRILDAAADARALHEWVPLGA